MEPFRTYRTASGKDVAQLGAEFAEKRLISLGRGLYREGQGIMAASQPLVPVDTAALRSSDYVAEPEVLEGGRTVRVELGYGGPAAKINPKTGESTDGYALVVHENLEAFHKVGTAKFLELPFNQATRGMDGRLAEFVRKDKGFFDLPVSHLGNESEV